MCEQRYVGERCEVRRLTIEAVCGELAVADGIVERVEYIAPYIEAVVDDGVALVAVAYSDEDMCDISVEDKVVEVAWQLVFNASVIIDSVRGVINGEVEAERAVAAELVVKGEED